MNGFILIAGFVLLIAILIMRKKILRFLRKIGLWKKAQEFKDKPEPVEPPKEPTDPIEEPAEPEPPKEETPEPTPTPPKKYFEIDYDRESSEDQTAYIQEQIKARIKETKGTPQRHLELFFPSGKVWTEGNLANNFQGKEGILVFEGASYLDIHGSESEKTIFYTKAPATPFGGNISKGDYSKRKHLWVKLSDNVTLNNIHIEGSNNIPGNLIGTTPGLTPEFWLGGKDRGSFKDFPAYTSYWEGEHGISVNGVDNFTSNNCSVVGVWGDGFYAGAGEVSNNLWKNSSNIKFLNSYLRNIGRQGFAASNNVDGFVIDGFDADLLRRAFVDLEPQSLKGYVRNVIIRNGNVRCMMNLIAAMGKGDASNVEVYDVEYETTGMSLKCRDSKANTEIEQTGKTTVPRRKNWHFHDNTRVGNSFGSRSADILFCNTDNVIIENNKNAISKAQGKKAVELSHCGGALKVINNDWITPDVTVELHHIDPDADVLIENNIP